MTADLHPCPAPPAAPPRYPTRVAWRAARGSLVVAGAAGALSGSALSGCNLLWPILAPIFEHGYGHASFGCIVVAPPTFLSEERAAEIVREELEAAGYAGTLRTGDACASYTLDRVFITRSCGPDQWTVLEGAVIGDRFDVCDAEGNLSLEVVTADDHWRISDEGWGLCWISVSGFSVRDMADYVALQAAAGARTRYVGIFYDPISYEDDWSADTADSGLTAEEQSDLDLRAQVRDFVAWLEGRR